jgi:hypothetical protein
MIGAGVSFFLIASAFVLVFFKDRLAYGLALAGGLIGLPIFAWIEASLAPWNSWIFLNCIGELPQVVLAEVVLRILSSMLIVVTIAISSFRLLPERWGFRAVPLRQRTWPALVAAILLVGTWFVRSVIPYSVPAYNHGGGSEFRILHIEKRGLEFHETVVTGSRDGKAWVSRQNRRLFHYRFHGRMATIALAEQSHSIRDRAHALAWSSALAGLHTKAAKPLWSWRAEGWYVLLRESRVLAFTTEDGTDPPGEVAALLREIERLPAAFETPYAGGDICLGFCYDPLAALGFYTLQRRMELQQ